MSEALHSVNWETGELKFEFLTTEDTDSDKKFTSSIKNLLVLIKDFYGADNVLVYWFNKNKNSFKLLASSEDNWKEVLNERFEAGNDQISRVCLSGASEIINFETDQDKKLIRHYKGYFNIKSIIVNPLLIDDDAVAVVLCESKTLNFFGTPNLYTLQVFSESITNYVKYYSLNEDFEYQDRILKLLASGKMNAPEEIYDVIEKSFIRYVDYQSFFIILNVNKKFLVAKQYSVNKAIGNQIDSDIEEGSLVMKSIQNSRISTHYFDRNESKEYRFSRSESANTEIFFCVIPVLAGDYCIGAFAFETKANVYEMQKILSKAYKLIFPQFMYLKNLESFTNESPDINDRQTGFYNRTFFESRLASEISRCRIFDESHLYCVYITVDNPDTKNQSLVVNDFLDKVISDVLREKFIGYDMVFRTGQGKFALMFDLDSDERIFLEIEKIRKYISTKIYNVEGKEISFTVSCAIKKYDDLNLTQEDFLKELDNLIALAVSEGGNSVKL